jgi:hypothetical protein
VETWRKNGWGTTPQNCVVHTRSAYAAQRWMSRRGRLTRRDNSWPQQQNGEAFCSAALLVHPPLAHPLTREGSMRTWQREAVQQGTQYGKSGLRASRWRAGGVQSASAHRTCRRTASYPCRSHCEGALRAAYVALLSSRQRSVLVEFACRITGDPIPLTELRRWAGAGARLARAPSPRPTQTCAFGRTTVHVADLTPVGGRCMPLAYPVARARAADPHEGSRRACGAWPFCSTGCAPRRSRMPAALSPCRRPGRHVRHA